MIWECFSCFSWGLTLPFHANDLLWRPFTWNAKIQHPRSPLETIYMEYRGLFSRWNRRDMTNLASVLTPPPPPPQKKKKKKKKKHFYITKLGFTGVHIIFSYFCSNHSLMLLVRTASARRFWRVSTIYSLSRNMKNIIILIWKLSVFGGDIFNIFEYACFRNEYM